MQHDTASGRWLDLDGKRQSFITRCEKYAAFTIPKICMPEGADQENTELQHDYQSLGAQAVNHLSNKLMLALFAPSRPFFRLDPSDKLKAKLLELNMDETELSNGLSDVEARAVRELDRKAIRPKMYDGIKHIIVTGNAMLVFEKSKLRVLGLKNYCVKRDTDGRVLELLLKEPVHRSALEPAVEAEVGAQLGNNEDQMVDMYKWIKRKPDGDYYLTTWINSIKLSDKYEGKWPEEKLPYRAVTWDLASGADYGTGHVEDYAGDFAALSIMSKATVQAALLASEFRWLVNPAGATSPKDFEMSENGAAISGVQGDVTLLQSGKNSDLAVNLQISQQYIARIGQGFMLQSAVTRHAERVTAEEVRLTAEELETSLGGAYSRIAVDVQVPLAFWLMSEIDSPITGTDLIPTIVTGLAALSRAGDRDNLILFFQDMAMVSQLPPELQGRMKLGPIQAALASARGLNKSLYLLTDEEFAAKQAEEMKQQMAMELANRMPIANPDGVNASQALLAEGAANTAIASRRAQQQ